MALSIVIVNWNSKNFLRECLHSIRETHTNDNTQIIVVDGGSFDGCGEMIAREFPEVCFVQSHENCGFGRCNNLGFSHATGDTLLLLNPDTVVAEGAINRLIQTLESHHDAGLVGAHLLNSDGTLQWFGIHHLPTPLNCALDSDRIRRRWWAKHGPADDGPAVPVEAVSGACILMKSDTFRRVGGFDPKFFMYGEDMDLCFNVTQLGLKVYYAPEARVTHHGGGSSKNEFSKFSTIMIREALWCYMRKNHGVVTALIYRVTMGVSAVLRLLTLGVLSAFSGLGTRGPKWVSIKKWWAVLCWSFGAESWAREKFIGYKNAPKSISPTMEISP